MPQDVTKLNHTLDNIPKGKYIICARDLSAAEDSYQCTEVIIEKYSGHSEISRYITF